MLAVDQVEELHERHKHNLENDTEVDQLLARVAQCVSEKGYLAVESEKLQELDGCKEHENANYVVEYLAPVADILELHVIVSGGLLEVRGEFVDLVQAVEIYDDCRYGHGTYTEVDKVPELFEVLAFLLHQVLDKNYNEEDSEGKVDNFAGDLEQESIVHVRQKHAWLEPV